MKKSAKLIIAGAAVGAVVAGAFIAKHYISVDKDNQSIQIIGGADGPTSVFLAGEIPGDEKQAEYTSISMEEAKEASSKLAVLGYTNIYEFGGILDWDGEIEK